MNNYDKINVPKFSKCENNGYLCSMCGQYTTLSNSVSNKGWNLICRRCMYKIKGIIDPDGGMNILTNIQNVGIKRELLNANDGEDTL